MHRLRAHVNPMVQGQRFTTAQAEDAYDPLQKSQPALASPTYPDRSELRRHMRRQRRALDAHARREAALRASRTLLRTPFLRSASHIGCYFANDGEIDLAPFMQRACEMGKFVYVPVIDDAGMLRFTRYRPGDALCANRFGIPEPRERTLIPPRLLDVILAPLVAFDDDGNRLGMGGGYYDRSFSFLRHRRHWLRPRLIGAAYEFQRVARLPAQPWDVPLHGVVTERGFTCFPRA